VTVVQNSVERRDMGSATSSVIFFRSMGGAFGTAIFGAVLTSRLGVYLADAAGGGGLPADLNVSANNVQQIQALPADAHAVVVDAWVKALHDVFLVALPFVVIAFVAAFFIPELTLKTGASDEEAPAEPALAMD
jgi:hypothetical protein